MRLEARNKTQSPHKSEMAPDILRTHYNDDVSFDVLFYEKKVPAKYQTA
jgi:hypothetical protein